MRNAVSVYGMFYFPQVCTYTNTKLLSFCSLTPYYSTKFSLLTQDKPSLTHKSRLPVYYISTWQTHN